MEGMYTVFVGDDRREYAAGTLYKQIADDFQKDFMNTIALVIVDGKIQELLRPLKSDCSLEFITLKDLLGHSAYIRTAFMLFLKAMKDVAGPDNIRRTKIEFAIGRGYYCTVKGELKIDESLVKAINDRMHQLVEENIPITKKSYPLEEALELFRQAGMEDKIKLFKYRRSSSVNVYHMEDYYDYFYGYMLPSTGYVRVFDLISYEGGMMLLLPDRNSPAKIDFFEPREKLFSTLMQSSRWGEMLQIDNVGDLNDRICSGGLSQLILVQEALQETRMGEIAADIKSREDVKFVMIAGPSSSGKTTFSHRLSIQLRSMGLKPHPIGLDDYYINREDTPRDENGEFDFECLEALDVERFNRDMTALLAGEETELPIYNFKTGRREPEGRKMQLGEEDVLVIEGIHGLNDKLSYSLPKESKYKIYISALTSLNVDDHNRITTTDGRLLRRMVRDARTRGTSARQTLSMWDSVRRGEEKYIFPFQEKVDATFNSVLIYELSVLKQYAEPLLFGIQKGEPGYYEARRLLKFLEYFLGVSSEEVPANSIVREFIGGSLFNA